MDSFIRADNDPVVSDHSTSTEIQYFNHCQRGSGPEEGMTGHRKETNMGVDDAAVQKRKTHFHISNFKFTKAKAMKG